MRALTAVEFKGADPGLDCQLLRGRRTFEHDVPVALYISDMFATGHDAANHEAVRRRALDEVDRGGLALRVRRKLVDKLTRGAAMRR